MLDSIHAQQTPDKFATTAANPALLKPAENHGVATAQNTLCQLPHPTRLYSPANDTQPTKAKQKRARDLTIYEKLQLSIEAAGRAGGWAFSLNLGIGRESALLHSDDPARRFAHELSREFRKALGHDLPYSFALELCVDAHGYQRLHAHGTLVPGSEDMAAIQRALIRAGGKIEGSLANRQLEMEPLWGAAGWTSYMLKNVRWRKALPDGRFIYISRPLAQAARAEYEEFGLSRHIPLRRRATKK